MDAQDFLKLRCSFGLLRQNLPRKNRISFEEFALLAHLRCEDRPLTMTDLAIYQGALRPTITHRVTHLASHNYVVRIECATDKRNVSCELSSQGELMFQSILVELSRIGFNGSSQDEQILRLADGAGSVTLCAADLILAALKVMFFARGASIGKLAASLGLLQPTVSMAVAALEEVEEVERVEVSGSRPSSFVISLTDAGIVHADKIVSRIEAV